MPDTILGTIPNPFSSLTKPVLEGPDFPQGLEIIEIVDGQERKLDKIVLLSDQLPFAPFPYGGEQKIVKEYYPGFSEPVVQVLGPRESDVRINGRLKTKHFKTKDFKRFAIAVQESIEAMRLRGNLVKITLGEFQRFGFIESAHFKLYQVTRIEYEINFSIYGFNPPKNCKFVKRTAVLPFDKNKALIQAGNAFLAQRPLFIAPSRSLFDQLTAAIGEVANVIHGVTSFIDAVLAIAENTAFVLNRAIGLIKNARASISKYKRQVAAIQLSFAQLGSTFSAGKKSTGTYRNAHAMLTSVSLAQQMELILAQLQAQFESIAVTVPIARYKVVFGDTLQKIAFKFYKNSDDWKPIYDHNKLTSTSLTIGSTLEIPRL